MPPEGMLHPFLSEISPPDSTLQIKQVSSFPVTTRRIIPSLIKN